MKLCGPVKKRVKDTALLAGFLAIFFLTTVVFPGGSSAQEEGEEGLTIGVVLPLSGANSVFGRIQKNSMIMAAEKINAEGGINGRQLILDIRNSGNRSKAAKDIARSFIEKKGYALIVGGFSSSSTRSIGAYAEKMVVPYLAITGSSDAITQNGYRYVFSLNPPIGRYSSGLVELISERVKPAKIAVVYEKSSFGKGNASAILAAATASGWDVVVNYGFTSGGLGLESLLEAISDREPDVLYISCYSKDAGRILTELAERKISVGLVAGSSELGKETFAASAGPYGENALVSVIWAPGLPYQGMAEYVSEFSNRFGKVPDYHGAEAYASIQVAANALRKVSFVEPAAVTEALASTEMDTVFGYISFVESEGYNNQNMPPTYVVQWQNSKKPVVWPPDFAESDLILPGDKAALETLLGD